MKEFSAQTGGRYVYVDDVLNLQELSLAFAEIFQECDNFIVSGCQVSGSNISSGLVYLNGKLRRFPGATGISQWPQYIYELNQTEQVSYASGGAKVGRNIYGCAIASTVPTTLDPLTNQTPVSMRITQTGGTLMKDAFFGRYALLLNPAAGTQTVSGNVNFNNDIRVLRDIISNRAVKVASGSALTTITYESGVFTIQSKSASNNLMKVSFTDGTGFQFYINGVLKATIGADTIQFAVPISSTKGTFGSSVLTGSNLYNGTSAANNGELNINMVGYNGGTAYYRNTYIGNGKNRAIISVLGSAGTVEIAGTTTIASSGREGLILLANLPKSNAALQQAVYWKDSNKEVIGFMGFTENADKIFRIANSLAGIVITGQGYVDLGPTIRENGIALSDKYVLQTTMTTQMQLKANAADVYTKTEANNTFGSKANGLSQFVTQTNTQAVLRSQIGAAATTDLSSYAKLSNLLSDMATTDAKKRQIRENIGAAGVGDFQAKLRDTGWLACTGPGTWGLYARQIGNVVCVQGYIKTTHTGTVFTIPNAIDAPAFAVYWDYNHCNSHAWRGAIEGGSHNFNVTYCSGSCGYYTQFSITYMV